MRLLPRMTILICFSMLIAACHPVAEDKQVVQADLARLEVPDVSQAQEDALRDGNNTFAFNIYRQINQGIPGNLIFSPYSIWLAFSMVYGGAQGETESQMTDIFHFLSQEDQHLTLNAIDQRLPAYRTLQKGEEDGTPFQLELANAVWSQKGYAFNQSYLDLLALQYGAGLHVVDFQRAAEAAREAINAWVGQNTDGRIKEIAGPGSVSADTRLVLTNAILFKAGWAYEFDQQATKDGPFTLLDGKQVITPLMHLQAPLYHVEKEDYTAVRLPYVYQKAEMWIIMPADGKFNAVLDNLNINLMSEVKQQMGMDQVTLTLPAFDFESELSLNELLIEMGLTEAFCPAGDYNGIAEGGGLCISQAVHKTTITVDEQGTEATAATLIAMPVSIMEKIELVVDRPFLFAIVEQESGLILFLGQVLDPSLH